LRNKRFKDRAYRKGVLITQDEYYTKRALKVKEKYFQSGNHYMVYLLSLSSYHSRDAGKC